MPETPAPFLVGGHRSGHRRTFGALLFALDNLRRAVVLQFETGPACDKAERAGLRSLFALCGSMLQCFGRTDLTIDLYVNKAE